MKKDEAIASSFFVWVDGGDGAWLIRPHHRGGTAYSGTVNGYALAVPTTENGTAYSGTVNGYALARVRILYTSLDCCRSQHHSTPSM